jgi:hypothetical protein
MNIPLLPMALAGSIAVSGCVASIAAGAVGQAVRAAEASRPPFDAAGAALLATEACRTRAAGEGGAARIIDVVARSRTVRVYGAVVSDQWRRAFECDYRNGAIARFELREVRTPR